MLGDLTSLHARPPARARLHGPHGAARQDHRGAARAGRGVLRPARRDDDPDRPLHRARARDRAVHRRRVAHAAAQVPALRRARRRAVGDDVLRARLRLLALVRPAHRVGLARRCSRSASRSRSSSRSSSSSGCSAARSCRRRRRRGSPSSSSGRCCARSRRTCARLAPDRAAARARSPSAPARFVWNRFTPGELGLEVTTLLAIAAVGSFTFFLLGSALDERTLLRSATASRSTSPTASTPTGRRTSSVWRHGARLVRRVVGAASSARPRSGRRSRRRFLEAAVLPVGLVLTLARRRRRQGGLRPPARRRARTSTTEGDGVSVRPRRVRGRLGRLRRRARPRRAATSPTRFAAVTAAVVLAAVVGADARLPARALPLRRRRRAGASAAAIFGAAAAWLALVVGSLRQNERPQP